MKTFRAVAIVGAMAIAGGVIAAGDPGSANADTVGAELLAPTSILTATAGLIAFHIGLYTLVGRERKSPYIINSVFLVFLFCLVIAAIALLSTLVPDWLQGSILYTSGALLFVAFLFSASGYFGSPSGLFTLLIAFTPSTSGLSVTSGAARRCKVRVLITRTIRSPCQRI